MTVDELSHALRSLGIGEEKRGYGHATSEELAELLLDYFDIRPLDAST